MRVDEIIAMSIDEAFEIFEYVAEEIRASGQELRDFLEENPDEDTTAEGILAELELQLKSELEEVQRLRAECR